MLFATDDWFGVAENLIKVSFFQAFYMCGIPCIGLQQVLNPGQTCSNWLSKVACLLVKFDSLQQCRRQAMFCTSGHGNKYISAFTNLVKFNFS